MKKIHGAPLLGLKIRHDALNSSKSERVSRPPSTLMRRAVVLGRGRGGAELGRGSGGRRNGRWPEPEVFPAGDGIRAILPPG